MREERDSSATVTRRPGASPTRRSPSRRSPLLLAFGAAVPYGATAAVAATPSVVALPSVGDGLPLPIILVVVVQLLGLLLAREIEAGSWRRLWLLALATTTIAFPALALQAASAREAFVSLELGSAGTLFSSTVVAIAALLGVAILAAAQAIGEPEHASVLFAPAALLVPAMLAAPGTLDERSALAALAESMALAAIATGLAWLSPPGGRLLAGPVALAAQFMVLWLLGYSPRFGADQGAVVPLLSILLVVTCVVTVVAVPVVALAARGLRDAIASRGRSGVVRQRDDPRPLGRGGGAGVDDQPKIRR